MRNTTLDRSAKCRRGALLAVASIAAATTLGTSTAAAAAPVSPAPHGGSATADAFRSVDIQISNESNCYLILADRGTWHGVYTQNVPSIIYPNHVGTGRAESNGFLTGVEGWALYNALCPPDLNNQSSISMIFNNPTVGSTSYRFNVLNTPFGPSWIDAGHGDNAGVTYHIKTS